MSLKAYFQDEAPNAAEGGRLPGLRLSVVVWHLCWAGYTLFGLMGLLLLPAWFGAYRAHWRPRPWSWRLAQALALLAALTLLLRLGPGLYQANLPWILLLLPAQLALAWSLGSARRA